ncbi:MAG TPA: VWA domain-containing protein [Aquella sp.]|nr:VWA domain-containing protein [Aquella sp.]
MTEYFHFLRPWWFLALIPAILLFIFALRSAKSGDNVWNKHCDPHLLEHLLSKNNSISRTWLPCLLLSLWAIAIVALAGPTWSLYAQNVYQKNVARVIALDVSQSMNAADIAPSRLERGKYKILDLLHNIREGQTGMIVFSSLAFVVSPLTSDSNTIASQVPVLNSSIVPVQGSDISLALTKSASLIQQAGFTRGEIILVTDSTPSDKDLAIARKLAGDGYTISVLGIGTKQGGPVTNSDGSLVTDSNGNVTLASLDSTALDKLAGNGGGEYIAFSNNNSDIKQLLDETHLNTQGPTKKMETKSLWKDEGHYLVWLLIILSSFIARRGWLDRIC